MEMGNNLIAIIALVHVESNKRATISSAKILIILRIGSTVNVSMNDIS